nr:immunoglobulin light chain junction region [Macaca mulatta]MOY08284.1 immunoglobulin light chain junction region [Macaca mulatta]MOY08689.1 immunoglobulin light chain junction region [Macaca mulatta]MOY09167.1 immunoglobulin light chain junction region [Macaca mulatta]MOY09424.1 immunoglobulin light chain junction region [Macaca mulatta]
EYYCMIWHNNGWLF